MKGPKPARFRARSYDLAANGQVAAVHCVVPSLPGASEIAGRTFNVLPLYKERGSQVLPTQRHDDANRPLL
jgi:hypothetical protein